MFVSARNTLFAILVLAAPGVAFATNDGPRPSMPSAPSCGGAPCRGPAVSVPSPSFSTPSIAVTPPSIGHGPVISVPPPNVGCGVDSCGGTPAVLPTPTIGCGGPCGVVVPDLPSAPCGASCNPVSVPVPVIPGANLVVVGAGASASASSMAIAIAQTEGQTIELRSSYAAAAMVEAGVESSAEALGGASAASAASAESYRTATLTAVCLDASGRARPAPQTFAGREVADSYAGELFRCAAGETLRVMSEGRATQCDAGQALWFENGRLSCRARIAQRDDHERILLARYGAGEKVVRLRTAQTAAAAATPNRHVEAVTVSMDGGVGQGGW